MSRKTLLIAVLLTALALMIAPAAAQEDEMMGAAFEVTITNVSAPASATGVFNTPLDADGPGPALPGSGYSFSFEAEPGQYLSFATMLVQSNDLFFAPADTGIALFDAEGNPITGDITDLVLLWDAGTEVNEEPGVGENQAPRQSGPDTGDDEDGLVLEISDVMDGFTYPAVDALISVSLDYADGTFTVTVNNVSGESELAGPIAPGVFAVHGRFPFLFGEGSPASPGIEAMAEDGNPAILIEEADALRIGSPISPGAYVIHSNEATFFTTDDAASAGIEAVAEDGNPAPLLEEFDGAEHVHSAGVFNTPDGAMEPGPAFPGDAYVFSFNAVEGDYLSFATMFVQSNDLFLAPEPTGIALFDDMGSPISGDITAYVLLWDAGTEVNEEPGVGENQAPRQSGPNTGDDEMGVITADIMDGFTYPAAPQIVRVTLRVADDMGEMDGDM